MKYRVVILGCRIRELAHRMVNQIINSANQIIKLDYQIIKLDYQIIKLEYRIIKLEYRNVMLACQISELNLSHI